MTVIPAKAGIQDNGVGVLRAIYSLVARRSEREPSRLMVRVLRFAAGGQHTTTRTRTSRFTDR